jgi:hypothetical protein
MVAIAWEISIDAGLSRARQEGRLALIDFSAAPA